MKKDLLIRILLTFILFYLLLFIKSKVNIIVTIFLLALLSDQKLPLDISNNFEKNLFTSRKNV
uniref:Uncharacterized protein n=1 Tax=viral metagenome TaxID=1070528 RepID=A0A6C0IHU8_9ZZZZ